MLDRELADALTEVLAENAVGPARRGRLARARAAVKHHPDYSEAGYLRAVDAAFENATRAALFVVAENPPLDQSATITWSLLAVTKPGNQTNDETSVADAPDRLHATRREQIKTQILTTTMEPTRPCCATFTQMFYFGLLAI